LRTKQYFFAAAVGLHKGRCRHGYNAEQSRQRQNFMPAYAG